MKWAKTSVQRVLPDGRRCNDHPCSLKDGIGAAKHLGEMAKGGLRKRMRRQEEPRKESNSLSTKSKLGT